MPESVNSSIILAKNEIRSIRPWVWLVQLGIDGTNVIRVAGHDEQLTWGLFTWDPFPIQIGVQNRTSDGSLPELTLTVGNLSGYVSSLLEAGSLIDQSVTIRLIHTAASVGSVFESSYRVKSATVTSQVATLNCEIAPLLDASFPAQRFMRGRCRFLPRYGDVSGCQYDKSLPNAISGTSPEFDPTTCDGTLEGENGCRVHGLNEIANGMAARHPLRFGGFPGIPRGRARV